MNEHPDSWSAAQLGDIARVEMGQSPDSRSYNDRGDGLPFFQGKAEFGALYPTARKWCSSPTRIAEPGDILLSVRAPVGPTNLANEKCCIGRGLAAIRADEPISQKYLLHYFRHIQPWLSEQGTGTTFAAIGGDFLRSLMVALAPADEQQRIADKLDTLLARVDACRARLDRVPLILKRFRQAVLTAATSGRLTEDWRERQNISEDSWQTRSGEAIFPFITSGSRGWAKYYTESGALFLRVGNLDHGTIELDLTDVQHVNPPDTVEGKRTRVEVGDILISITADVGMTALIRSDIGEAYINQHLCLARQTGEHTGAYLAFFLASPSGGIAQLANMQRGMTKAGLALDDIRSIEFQIPERPEQDEIVRRIEDLFAYADRLEARYRAARSQVDRLTPCLLAKAFRGELVPQDPGDEPAAVLLERIRAARMVTANGSAGRRQRARTNKADHSINEVRMLKREDVVPSHLADLLQTRGQLTAEALWLASQLEIDDFYDQLSDEEALGRLREIRSGSMDVPRLLEAT